jgi:hypothetical protein
MIALFVLIKLFSPTITIITRIVLPIQISAAVYVYIKELMFLANLTMISIAICLTAEHKAAHAMSR